MISSEQWLPADGLTLEPNAMKAAKEQEKCLALTAGPGAGKTEMLAQRADFLFRTGTCRYPKRILAISFKVDASTNLKERVKRRCGSELASRFDSYTFHAFAKRIIDICGSIVGLIICGLVSLVLVPLIRKDGGPAIFAQTRIGKNGRHFTFYKFRSMCVDAEDKKRELMEQNTMQGGMFKVDDDPRITKIGRFIRKTSLDELPQFYNVLKGDMSLVGTRPPTVDEYEKYTPEQKRRLSFKPGITGLWQVSGRSEIKDFDEVVKLDVAYIDDWTIWKDIEILLKTVKVVFMRDGAK